MNLHERKQSRFTVFVSSPWHYCISTRKERQKEGRMEEEMDGCIEGSVLTSVGLANACHWLFALVQSPSSQFKCS